MSRARDELAERAVKRLADRLGKPIVTRADPASIPMRKSVCLGSSPIALFVCHENTVFWSPLDDGEERSA